MKILLPPIEQIYKSKQVTEELVHLAIENPVYAKHVLRVYIDSVKNKITPNELVLSYLASSLEKILDDEPAEIIFGLSKKRGRKNNDEKQDYLLAAKMVDYIDLEKHLYDDAKSMVAHDANKSEGTIKRLYDLYGPLIRERLNLEQKLVTESNNKPPKTAIELVEYWMFDFQVQKTSSI